jgi:hypothetical protein
LALKLLLIEGGELFADLLAKEFQVRVVLAVEACKIERFQRSPRRFRVSQAKLAGSESHGQTRMGVVPKLSESVKGFLRPSSVAKNVQKIEPGIPLIRLLIVKLLRN